MPIWDFDCFKLLSFHEYTREFLSHIVSSCFFSIFFYFMLHSSHLISLWEKGTSFQIWSKNEIWFVFLCSFPKVIFQCFINQRWWIKYAIRVFVVFSFFLISPNWPKCFFFKFYWIYIWTHVCTLQTSLITLWYTFNCKCDFCLKVNWANNSPQRI